MTLRVDPFNIEERYQDLLDRAYCLHTQAALYESEHFDKDVVR